MMDFDYSGLTVKIAGRADAERISQLRIAAYHEATGSKLQSFDFLKWNDKDDNSLVLYFENAQGEAISSMRASSYSDGDTVAKLFDITLKDELPTPALAIDKMVTLVEHRRHKLSAVLRYLTIEAAKLSHMGSITATINDNASRVPLLREMGYQVLPADISHRLDSVYDNDCKVLLAVLPFAGFDEALAIASKNLPCDIGTITIEPGYIEKVKAKLR